MKNKEGRRKPHSYWRTLLIKERLHLIELPICQHIQINTEGTVRTRSIEHGLSSSAWLSKLTAFSMCQSRWITPGRYKRTRRQSKAVGSTGVDSGQLLEVIKAFEPESCSRPPFVSPLALLEPDRRGVYFDLGPWRCKTALFISAGEREKQRETES